MKRKIAIISGGILLASLAGWLCYPKTALLQGEVVIRQLNISPRVSARVDKVLAREGDAVRREQTVATLYAPDVLAKFSQAQAPRDLAQKNYARVKELFDGGVVSAQKLDEAKAGVAQTQGAAEATMTFVDELTLTAPADGEIASVVLEKGELASPGVPVLTMLDTADVWVSFNIREDLLSHFKMQDVLEIQIPSMDKKTHPFRITYISKLGDYAVWSATKTRGEFDMKTFEVRAKPVEPLPDLRQGMTALLRLK